MDDKTMHALRDHYDTQSTASEMDDGHWEADVQADPMVTTSLRLPKSLLDWVRDQADSQHIKPTALIRRWIEDRRTTDDASDDVATRLKRLEDAVFAQRRETD